LIIQYPLTASIESVEEEAHSRLPASSTSKESLTVCNWDQLNEEEQQQFVAKEENIIFTVLSSFGE
jgi:hypothetical protein